MDLPLIVITSANISQLTRKGIVITTAFAVSDQECSVVVACMKQPFLGLQSLQFAEVPASQQQHKNYIFIH